MRRHFKRRSGKPRSTGPDATLVVAVPSEVAFICDRGREREAQLAFLAMRAKEKVSSPPTTSFICLALGESWADIDRRTQGESTFGIDHEAAAAGTTITVGRQWCALGIVRPSLTDDRGHGRALLFTKLDLLVAAVCGALSRRKISRECLIRVSALLYGRQASPAQCFAQKAENN